MAHKIKGMNASWDYAFRFAKISHRMLKHAEVAVSMYWTWQNNYGIMSADAKTKYPSYYITRHQTDFLNSGTQIIHSISSAPEILSISGINEKGENVIQLINLKNVTVKVNISGINGSLSKSVTTTENSLWEEDELSVKQTNNGNVVELKPTSVNTLIF